MERNAEVRMQNAERKSRLRSAFCIHRSAFFLLILLVAPLLRAADQSPDTYCNPLDVLIADPFVLHHDGTYYLYGTSRARDGFDCWTSRDLVRWRYRGPVYQRNDND